MTESADDKVTRMVAQMYREQTLFDPAALDYQLHLASCDTMRAENAEAINGSYGCESGCEYMDLEALIKCDCPTIADEEYTYGTFGDTYWLLGHLDDMDKGERDNLDHWKSFVFRSPENLDLRKNLRRIEEMKEG